MTGWDYPGIEPSSIDGVIFDLPQVKIPTTLFPICGDPISPVCQKVSFLNGLYSTSISESLSRHSSKSFRKNKNKM